MSAARRSRSAASSGVHAFGGCVEPEKVYGASAYQAMRRGIAIVRPYIVSDDVRQGVAPTRCDMRWSASSVDRYVARSSIGASPMPPLPWQVPAP